MNSTQSFRSYPLTIDSFRKEYQEKDLNEVYKNHDNIFQNKYGIPFSESLEYEVLSVEQGFVNDGRNYVFMESKVIDHLYSLKYRPDTLDYLTLPFDSFSISPSSDSKLAGKPLMPILVVSSKSVQQGYKCLSGDFGVTPPILKEEPLFTIMICGDGNKSGARESSSITASQLKQILQQDADDCDLSEIVGSYNQHSDRILDKDRGISLMKSVKLVASFLLYNQITQDKYLIEGFPETFAKKPKRLGLMKRDMNLVRGCFFGVDVPKRESKKNHHIRIGHYRQLVNERYYKGEYESWVRGSRWVEVSPSLIGGGEVHTQSVQSY